MKEFFKFNKQKVIISLIYIFILSVIGAFFFKYNFSAGVPNHMILSVFVYPVEALFAIVFHPFLDAEKIQSSLIYKLFFVIFSSAFVLTLKVAYYYTVACFIFWIKNKFTREKEMQALEDK